MFLIYLSFVLSSHATEPCEKEAIDFSKMVAKTSKARIIEPPKLIWFSETVSYGFIIKDMFKGIRKYTVKYANELSETSDDLGKPDACRLMISGEVDDDGNYRYSNY